MKNKIELKKKEGYLEVHHNGNIILIGNEISCYSINEIECGLFNLEIDVIYYYNLDKIRLDIRVYLSNEIDYEEPLTIKDTSIDIPLENIDNFQVIYENQINECKKIIGMVRDDYDKFNYKLDEIIYDLEKK